MLHCAMLHLYKCTSLNSVMIFRITGIIHAIETALFWQLL